MEITKDHVRMFELFAAACDQLNEYSRRLDASSRFFDVRTGADIRNYESGWRLQKWIGADIHTGGVEKGGLCACWWLELRPKTRSEERRVGKDCRSRWATVR